MVSLTTRISESDIDEVDQLEGYLNFVVTGLWEKFADSRWWIIEVKDV